MYRSISTGGFLLVKKHTVILKSTRTFQPKLMEHTFGTKKTLITLKYVLRETLKSVLLYTNWKVTIVCICPKKYMNLCAKVCLKINFHVLSSTALRLRARIFATQRTLDLAIYWATELRAARAVSRAKHDAEQFKPKLIGKLSVGNWWKCTGGF